MEKDIVMNADIPFSEFQAIYNIIQIHRQRVASTVDRESLTMIWDVGGYVSQKLRSAEWGERELSASFRNIFRHKTPQCEGGAIVHCIRWFSSTIHIVPIVLQDWSSSWNYSSMASPNKSRRHQTFAKPRRLK